MSEYDVAVIGGGIVGLAHAWMAARRNLRVLLLERTRVAEGASVRNFGMIWPIGQPAGELYAMALRSRELWLELGTRGVIDLQECGSLHVAHAADELAVLEEFCGRNSHGAQMLTAEEVRERTSLVNPQHLLGGMWSGTELRVDPRTASARIAAWLTSLHNVDCRFGTAVTQVAGGAVTAADGQTWRAGRVIVCSGSDLVTLFPETFHTSGLKLCKLQMLKSVRQPVAATLPPHLASGLTLRHYTSFSGCPTLPALQQRIAIETPELDKYGIHVMASQFPGGQVILGDSHEYGDAITPFDKEEIDDLMLRELQKVFNLQDWRIAERWHGVYAKHPELPVFSAQPQPDVHVFAGTGGAGMTMSFGLAEQAWERELS